MDGVILKVVVDNHSSDPEVFKGTLVHRLLEVSFEAEDLFVILEPLAFEFGGKRRHFGLVELLTGLLAKLLGL